MSNTLRQLHTSMEDGTADNVNDTIARFVKSNFIDIDKSSAKETSGQRKKKDVKGNNQKKDKTPKHE